MTHRPLTDEELVAFFEDALQPDARAALETRLSQDPEAQAKLIDWSRQNAEIQALYGPAADTPIPQRLTDSLHRPRHRRQAPRVAAMLSALAIGAAAGWMSHAGLSANAPTPQMAQAAIKAHDTYVVEVVHPVEVPATQRAHMDSWMSKRVGAQLSPPDLSAAGFVLMGGRILPADSGTAGLYMYEDADGQRITLYVTRAARTDRAFQFTGQGQTQSLHWADGGLGYALTGTLPRNTLRSMAEHAYDQML